MEKEIINKILSQMENSLSNDQLKKLKNVLFKIQSNQNLTNQSNKKE